MMAAETISLPPMCQNSHRPAKANGSRSLRRNRVLTGGAVLARVFSPEYSSSEPGDIRGEAANALSLAQAGEIGVGNHQPLPRLLSEYGKTWRGSDYWLTSDLLIRFDVIADYQRRRASGRYNVAKL